MNNKLYPFLFKPIYKEKIWGGNNLKSLAAFKNINYNNVGEIWLISGLENDSTIVSNGFLKGNSLNELIEIYMDDIVGEKVYEKFANHFPILIKFIDAADKLSVQVHPDDSLAANLYGSPNGKTEMWYIIKAEANSWIVNGFNTNIAKEEFVNYLKNNKIENILNFINIKNDDVFLIPAGRVHAIGKNIMLAEIQQASDYTYRIYDWNRNSKESNRKLHTELALQAIDFNNNKNTKISYTQTLNNKIPLVTENFFSTFLLILNKPFKTDYFELGSFIAYICIEGNADIYYYDNDKIKIKQGHAVLIPPEINTYTIIPKNYVKLLEIYLEP
ncbi:MAG TPA: class I mannose-6-phosphate isomerase [Bacteroidales bacterium]|nr:class I mannose-6-phosphate isomerase [Bacteroidales bacterium]